MKHIKLIASILIILASLFLAQQLISNAHDNQTNKIELAELNHIKYGLLSIDSWKEQISVIVIDEINKLDLTGENEQLLRKTVESQLIVLIDRVNAQIKKSNRGTAKGWVKQAFMDIFVSMEDIKKGIPAYTDALIAEMKKPENKGQIKNALKEKVQFYIKQTFDAQDMSQVNRILLKTHALNIKDAHEKLEKEIETRYKIIYRYAIILIIISALLFIIPAFDKKPLTPAVYFSLVASLIILLAVGVTTPMIDMEAKISEMSFFLLDHPIKFQNQVLYFQSKSVLDVFWIMITHETFQMKAVGVLMVCFSIVFPVAKLISSVAYYYNYRQSQKNSWVKFFVLKSGKWSMADVLVVAIFMAYIGFNGIISSQFGKLSSTTEEIVVLTTNGTSLQPGFYIFLAYAILALFLSMFLAKNSEQH